ncbi:hypothetical protein CDEST_00963 [Colletotrichum destructivum]|uniref:Uncharacterized protein n=1 Tax=Colletotrichum destructivum TaxID=34406 RepID=A0AAX4HXX9_9PEZI|nr:hypothetical protein CDEST_00963 [Colletotrichum destructivum]
MRAERICVVDVVASSPKGLFTFLHFTYKRAFWNMVTARSVESVQPVNTVVEIFSVSVRTCGRNSNYIIDP